MVEDYKNSTHFGFLPVSMQEKTAKVDAVFSSVVEKYDLMNNLMSLGIHHLWKKFAVSISKIRPQFTVLDLACGSCDLTYLLYSKLKFTGKVVSADLNAAMLNLGRDRLLEKGWFKNLYYVQSNAQALPFTDNLFDIILMGFGLRNVANKDQALTNLFRVLKPGGKIMILEFTKPDNDLVKKFYDWYSFSVLPKVGKYIAKDEMSYRYLVESIRMHPNQEELKARIEKAGFEDCYYYNLTCGIVALHIAYKY